MQKGVLMFDLDFILTSLGFIVPVILVIIYILLFRAELCDPLAAILPLLFAQFCIKLIDFFRPAPQAAQKTKDGDSTP